MPFIRTKLMASTRFELAMLRLLFPFIRVHPSPRFLFPGKIILFTPKHWWTAILKDQPTAITLNHINVSQRNTNTLAGLGQRCEDRPSQHLKVSSSDVLPKLSHLSRPALPLKSSARIGERYPRITQNLPKEQRRMSRGQHESMWPFASTLEQRAFPIRSSITPNSFSLRRDDAATRLFIYLFYVTDYVSS